MKHLALSLFAGCLTSSTLAAGPEIEGKYVCSNRAVFQITQTGGEYLVRSQDVPLPLDTSVTGAKAPNGMPCSNGSRTATVGDETLVVSSTCTPSEIRLSFDVTGKGAVSNFYLRLSPVSADIIKIEAKFTTTSRDLEVRALMTPVSLQCVRETN